MQTLFDSAYHISWFAACLLEVPPGLKASYSTAPKAQPELSFFLDFLGYAVLDSCYSKCVH